MYVNPPYGKMWSHCLNGKVTYVDIKERKNLLESNESKWIKENLKMVSIYDWIKKCWNTAQSPGNEVIALIPAYVDTYTWHDWIWGKATSICFFKGRIRFELPNGKSGPAPMACALIYWGKENERFSEIFSQYGEVITLQQRQPSQ